VQADRGDMLALCLKQHASVSGYDKLIFCNVLLRSSAQTEVLGCGVLPNML